MPNLFRLLVLFGPLWIAAGSGCAFSGRYVLLEEYTPITTHQSQDLSLKGLKLYVGEIQYRYDAAREIYFDGDKGQHENNVAEPVAYEYVEMTAADADKWTQRQKAKVDRYKQNADDIIGGVRNGFGTTTSSVYALNPPGQWLADTIATEAKAQGAIVVSSPADADLALDGQIVWLYADLRPGVWSADYKVHMVVKMNVKPKGGATLERTIATEGGAMTQWATDYEYFRAIRDAHQKFLIKLIQDLRKDCPIA